MGSTENPGSYTKTRDKDDELGRNDMYAVFGVSKIKCRAKAEKLVDSHCADTGRAFTLGEYSQKLDEKARELFDSGKPQRISEIYPSREIAENYQEKVEEAGTAKLLSIKKRVCTMDENNQPVTDQKTGKQVGVKWVHA